LGIANPETVVGGYVNNGIAAGEGVFYGFGTGEISHIRFAPNALEIADSAGFSHQHAQVSTLRGERTGHMIANETGRACEENTHRKNLGTFILNADSGAHQSEQTADSAAAQVFTPQRHAVKAPMV
jgi:hypothetical protein